MKVLSLFAGIGGFDLGLTMAGHEIVAQVEIDDYCNKILAHHFPQARRYKDIKEVTGEQITRDCGSIELICGGFPCQDISTAGKGAGLDAERSGLWWEMHRLIDELRPRWVIIENVFALRVRGLNRVIAALEALGYKTEHWGIPAAAIGAPHERKRLFIVGYSNSHGCKQRPLSTISRKDLSESNSTSAYVADSDSIAGATGALETGGSMVAAGAISAKPGSDSPMEHSDSNGGQEGLIAGHCHKEIAATGNTSPIPDTDSDGIREQSGGLCRQDWIYSPFAFPAGPGQQQWQWEEPRTIESSLGYTIDGLPRKLALRALGNAVVPGIIYGIGRTINRVERAIAQKSL